MAKGDKGPKCRECGANRSNNAHKPCHQRDTTGDCIVHHQFKG